MAPLWPTASTLAHSGAGGSSRLALMTHTACWSTWPSFLSLAGRASYLEDKLLCFAVSLNAFQTFLAFCGALGCGGSVRKTGNRVSRTTRNMGCHQVFPLIQRVFFPVAKAGGGMVKAALGWPPTCLLRPWLSCGSFHKPHTQCQLPSHRTSGKTCYCPIVSLETEEPM